jgi:hypothetical protein
LPAKQKERIRRIKKERSRSCRENIIKKIKIELIDL